MCSTMEGRTNMGFTLCFIADTHGEQWTYYLLPIDPGFGHLSTVSHVPMSSKNMSWPIFVSYEELPSIQGRMLAT